MPNIRFVAGKTGAVDSRLLTCADADGLAVFRIADGVRLCVFEGNQRNNQIAFCAFGQLFVFGDNIFKRAFVDFQLVAALFKGHAEHVFVLNGGGDIVFVNRNDVVSAFAFRFQNFKCFVGVAGGNDAVGHFALNQLCGGHVADVGKRNPVAERGHSVGAARSRVSASKRRKLFQIIDPVDFFQRVGKRKTDRRARGADVFKRSGCR